jgi:putative redox protein
MKNESTIIWKGGMTFETEMDGHKLLLDAAEEVGGQNKGMRPKKLMLTALAGCTGMDVISILKKMKLEPDFFNVKVEGTLTEEHPKYYNSMHVIYEFKGKNLTQDKLIRAINLSIEKYCGVYAFYKKVITITYEIRMI